MVALAFQIPIAEDVRKVCQEVVQLTVQVLYVGQYIGVLVSGYLRLVGHRLELQLHPFTLVLVDLPLQNGLLLGLCGHLYDLILVLVETQCNQTLQGEVAVDNELHSDNGLNFVPMVRL